MNIVVCIKQVNNEINPFDACALECALQIENAKVTVLSMGRPSVVNMLKGLTRLGVHRTILLTDPDFAGSDTLATSYILSLAIDKLHPDLIICGRQSIDGDTAQVGPCLASLLQMPVITNVMTIHPVIGGTLSCNTRSGEEKTDLPAVLTVERINTLRFPSIRAKSSEVEVWTLHDIDADKNRCGLEGSPTRVLKTYENAKGKRHCKLISPSMLMGIITESLALPQHEMDPVVSKCKMKNAWVVGEKPIPIALQIAETITIIQPDTAAEIALLAKEQNPKVILWNNDLWSRKVAPQVAALLQTGLCADCTDLQTDGHELYMFRPAYSGNIMAKIHCRTSPVMATVRTHSTALTRIIVAAGKGARDCLTPLKRFASDLGADFGASRSLVDLGLAPYEEQIGLTGKTVSPQVYIACGISGTIQHICGMDQSNTIIAINKDSKAPIFDYADYGIIGDLSDIISLFQ